MDKSSLRLALIAALEEELRLQSDAAYASRDEATDEESRAEDKYDMRSQSAAYLAAGQARMAQETLDAISAFRGLPDRVWGSSEPIATGAVVTLEAGGRRTYYYCAPQRGGLDVKHAGVTVTVVTPQSPLGRQLLGHRLGDDVELPGRRGSVRHRIVAIV